VRNAQETRGGIGHEELKELKKDEEIFGIRGRSCFEHSHRVLLRRFGNCKMSLRRHSEAQWVSFYLALSVLVVLLTFSVKAQTPDQLNDAFKALKLAPSWINMNVERDGPRLISALDNFRGWPASSVKDILVAITDDPSVLKDHELDIKSKIFILNRYFFNVPVSIKDGVPIAKYGTWMKPEHSDLLYPLTQDSPGRFRILKGYTDSYTGSDYDGLAEFDYFEKRFDIRFPVKIVPKPLPPSPFQLNR